MEAEPGDQGQGYGLSESLNSWLRCLLGRQPQAEWSQLGCDEWAWRPCGVWQDMKGNLETQKWRPAVMAVNTERK